MIGTIPGGPAITVSGTLTWLAPAATQVVVGGTTTPLGSTIMSVFNGGSETSSGTETGTAPAEFTGSAVSRRRM